MLYAIRVDILLRCYFLRTLYKHLINLKEINHVRRGNFFKYNEKQLSIKNNIERGWIIYIFHVSIYQLDTFFTYKRISKNIFNN
jgi:hypothetical protein